MQPTTQPLNQPTNPPTSKPALAKANLEFNPTVHPSNAQQISVTYIILSCGTDLVLSLYSVAVLEPPPNGYENHPNLHSL